MKTRPQINAHIAKGKAFYQKKPIDFTNALKEFEIVVKLDPQNADAWWYVGTCLRNLSKNNLSRAIDCYTKARAIKPNDAGIFLSRGSAFYELGKYPETVSDTSRTIQLSPKEGRAYYYRSRAYSEMGKYPLAIADAEKSAQLNPSYAPTWLNSLKTKRTNHLNMALQAIKTINDYTWKGVELAINASQTKQLLLTFKLLKSTNNVFLNSAIHIAKELAAGKTITTVTSSAIPEIEKSLFKDIVVSEAVKQSAIVLGKLGSKIFGALLGEILFSDGLNVTEFKDQNFKMSVKSRINAMDATQYQALMKKSLALGQTKTTGTPKSKPATKQTPKPSATVKLISPSIQEQIRLAQKDQRRREDAQRYSEEQRKREEQRRRDQEQKKRDEQRRRDQEQKKMDEQKRRDQEQKKRDEQKRRDQEQKKRDEQNRQSNKSSFLITYLKQQEKNGTLMSGIGMFSQSRMPDRGCPASHPYRETFGNGSYCVSGRTITINGK